MRDRPFRSRYRAGAGGRAFLRRTRDPFWSQAAKAQAKDPRADQETAARGLLHNLPLGGRFDAHAVERILERNYPLLDDAPLTPTNAKYSEKIRPCEWQLNLLLYTCTTGSGNALIYSK